jgi:hypothetical protein
VAATISTSTVLLIPSAFAKITVACPTDPLPVTTVDGPDAGFTVAMLVSWEVQEKT